MNRVYCLYRVSTKGQVDKDDIPMQRLSCQEFALSKGWEIVKEFSEKGVSGFKVSSEKRDAIQQIKADAEKRKFDILLVFMFDRLGRRDDETPFVVQWFSDKGIQVWSVNEGEARFDNHVDKLMNYIRFWQASGESLKTSSRTKTRLAQLTEAGIFTGGTCPFGYELYDGGRINKKGNLCKDIRVNEDEAEIVRMIFRKTIDEGYGSYRLCTWLNRARIRTKTGGEWLPQSLNGVLTREMYLGYLINGDARSKYIPELQIIDEDTFKQAQSIIAQRRANNPIQRHVPLTTIGQTLLAGIIYCGTCGAKLTVTTQNKYIKLGNGRTKKKQTLTLFGAAVTYALNQRPWLERVLLDGRLELSNNRAERSIKPFVIGRKNWLFNNTPKGADASAIIYSIVETVKENGLNPYDYLSAVFHKAPNLSAMESVDALLPWNSGRI